MRSAATRTLPARKDLVNNLADQVDSFIKFPSAVTGGDEKLIDNDPRQPRECGNPGRNCEGDCARPSPGSEEGAGERLVECMNYISAATAASELAADAEGDEGLSTEYVCGSDELCLKKTAESLVRTGSES